MYWELVHLDEYRIKGELFQVNIKFNQYIQQWEITFNHNMLGSTVCCGLNEAKLVAEEQIKKKLTRDYTRFIGADDV